MQHQTKLFGGGIDGRHDHGQRRVVDGRDVEGENTAHRVKVHPAIGRAAVVLHLEADGGVSRAVAIRRSDEDELARRDVAGQHEVASVDGHAVKGEAASCWEGRDLHRQQVIGWVVVGVAETEVCRGEGVGRVFGAVDGLANTDRSLVDVAQVDDITGVKRSAATVGGANGDGVALGQFVFQQGPVGDGDDAGGGINGEASARRIHQGIANRVGADGRTVEHGRDHRAVGRTLWHGQPVGLVVDRCDLVRC